MNLFLYVNSVVVIRKLNGPLKESGRDVTPTVLFYGWVDPISRVTFHIFTSRLILRLKVPSNGRASGNGEKGVSKDELGDNGCASAT